jgi:hypothetical protein
VIAVKAAFNVSCDNCANRETSSVGTFTCSKHPQYFLVYFDPTGRRKFGMVTTPRLDNRGFCVNYIAVKHEPPYSHKEIIT